MVEVVLDGEQAERLASVKEEGGESMSTPWTASGSSKMSFQGTCFVSCLASVKNCPLVPSTAGTTDSQGSDAASQSRTYAKEALKEEIRVFVPGVWLTDVRDQDPVFYVCENSRLKIDGSTGLCRKSEEGCHCKASADPILLTSVTLADFSGSLRVTVGKEEFCTLVQKGTVEEVQAAIQETGLSSLTFQTRCDVILGANKCVSSGDMSYAHFEILRVEPQLLSPLNTEVRPLPHYMYLTEEVTRCELSGSSSSICFCCRQFLLVSCNCFCYRGSTWSGHRVVLAGECQGDSGWCTRGGVKWCRACRRIHVGDGAGQGQSIAVG